VSDPYDVAIAWYGPVGAVAALLCGQAGLRTLVLEPTTSVYHLPRAAHFDAEIMRTFQQVGVADAILPACEPVPGMDLVTGAGEVLRRFDTRSRRGEHGWETSWMFYQPEVEAALRAAVAECPTVDVLLGWQLTSFVPGDERVVLVASSTDGAVDDGRSARYLLGADGARSSVRRTARLAVEDLQFDQPWLVVDTVLGRPVELPEVAQQICDPARPSTFVPMAGDRRRWEFMLLPGERPEAMEAPERVRALLSRWIDPDDVEVVRAVVYTFHALIASPWRAGRVLIAGDAAHQMPPFFGQGMCAGIRDVRNLVWKLAMVVRGLASDTLLDTYETERSPHVRAIIEAAVALGGLLQTTDEVEAAARDEAMLADRANGDQAADDGAGLLPQIGAGLLDAERGGGRHLPQPPLADGSRFDDLLGDGFALLGRPGAVVPTWSDDVAAWWTSAGGRTLTIERALDDGALDDWIDDDRWVLVRPDRQTYAAGPDPSAIVAELHAAIGTPPG
jgi:3-(3-hydroxy-phenyl)propionate hydroxylase